MNKGFLFLIPIIATLLVALTLADTTMYAPWYSAGTLLVGITIVAFYIRKQHNDTNEPGKKP